MRHCLRRRFAERVDVLTVEIEHVDVDALEAVQQELGVDVEPTPGTLRLIQACALCVRSWQHQAVSPQSLLMGHPGYSTYHVQLEGGAEASVVKTLRGAASSRDSTWACSYTGQAGAEAALPVGRRAGGGLCRRGGRCRGPEGSAGVRVPLHAQVAEVSRALQLERVSIPSVSSQRP